MLIQKHKKCDICLNEITKGIGCYTIKGKAFYEDDGYSMIQKSKIDVCGKCLNEFKNWIWRKEVENKDNLEKEVKKIMDKYGIDDLKGGIRIEH